MKSCLLPFRCISVGLGYKGFEMALEWGLVERNGDICEVQMRRLGSF